MKEYQKPEVELISLIAEEAITSNLEGGNVDGEEGIESSIW